MSSNAYSAWGPGWSAFLVGLGLPSGTALLIFMKEWAILFFFAILSEAAQRFLCRAGWNLFLSRCCCQGGLLHEPLG